MPNQAEQLVKAERANRDAARAQLDDQIARIRSDIEQRGIGGRIAEEATAKALVALDDAALLARESRGVIGAAAALLALWFFRRPIFSAIAAMLGMDDATKGHDDHEQ